MRFSSGVAGSPSGSAEETTDEIINYTSALVTPSAAQYVVSKSADKQYSGLVSRGRYIFMLVKSESADNLASSDNLVYINQFTADENGVLNFDYPDSYADEYTALIFGGKTTDEAAEFTFDADTEKNNIMGDVDGDGSVTSADALLILRMSVDLEEITDENKPYADIDGDDSVSAADSLEVLRYSVGLSLNENIGKKVA